MKGRETRAHRDDQPEILRNRLREAGREASAAGIMAWTPAQRREADRWATRFILRLLMRSRWDDSSFEASMASAKRFYKAVTQDRPLLEPPPHVAALPDVEPGWRGE